VPFKRFDIVSIMEDFFSEPFGLGLFKAFKTPAIDVYEEGNKVVVKADLPGIDKKNIKVLDEIVCLKELLVKSVDLTPVYALLTLNNAMQRIANKCGSR